MAISKQQLHEINLRLENGSFPEPNTGCLLWSKAHDTFGYGFLRVGRKTTRTHRLAWTLNKGAIPKGFFVCHRCDTPACINVDHLFLGTPGDNTRDRDAKGRGVNLIAQNNSKKTHCAHGHEYSIENTHIRKRGSRECRACARERARLRLLRKKQC